MQSFGVATTAGCVSRRRLHAGISKLCIRRLLIFLTAYTCAATGTAAGGAALPLPLGLPDTAASAASTAALAARASATCRSVMACCGAGFGPCGGRGGDEKMQVSTQRQSHSSRMQHLTHIGGGMHPNLGSSLNKCAAGCQA